MIAKRTISSTVIVFAVWCWSLGYCDDRDASPHKVDVLTTHGRGTDYTDASIKAAMAALGASDRYTLVLGSGAWGISNDTTITKNITVEAAPGAILAIAADKLLTIDGPFQAGLYQVFQCEGTGKVVFGDASVREVYPQWWGVTVGGTPAANTAALSHVIQTAKVNGLSVFFSEGTYTLSLHFPIRQPTVPVVTVEDFKGITIRGEGKNSIIRTANPSGGCDVFQFNGVKNVIVKDVGVHSRIPTPNRSKCGSNAFSFTGGSSHITVQNVHVYAMPHFESGEPRRGLDGGSSFSIQYSAPSESTHIRILDCVSEGGTHGLHYVSGNAGTSVSPPHGIVFHNNVIKNHFHGLAITSSGGPSGPKLVRRQGMDFSATNNRFVDCQKGMYIAGVTGVTLIGNEVTSSLVSPNDDAEFTSYDARKYGISAGTVFDCNIIANIIYERDCDFFMNLYGGAAGQLDTPSENISVIGNAFSGTSRTPDCKADTGSNKYGLYVIDLDLVDNSINGRAASMCDSFLKCDPPRR